jgi:hypothetical protein
MFSLFQRARKDYGVPTVIRRAIVKTMHYAIQNRAFVNAPPVCYNFDNYY